jgi:lipoprotein signal peptidase
MDAHDWVTIKSDTVIKEPNPGTGTVTAGAVGDICDNIFHGGFFTDILLRNKFIP